MVSVEAVFHYAGVPSEIEMLAISKVREIYGIRHVEFDENEHSVLLEYDATRLSISDLSRLLRNAGIVLQEAAVAPKKEAVAAAS
jgi:hypothetical protein